MYTTEFYIEPVIVGFLVLLALLLPWLPGLLVILGQFQSLAASFALSGLALGVAYLIGVLIDRLIDTALAPIEQHNRLRFACKQIRKSAKAFDWSVDPFPEDEMRVQVRKMEDAANALIDGLRTRIRIMRAAAFLFPAITLSFATLLTRKCHWEATKLSEAIKLSCDVSVNAVNVLAPMAFAMILIFLPALLAKNKQPEILNKRWYGTLAPPRTDDLTGLKRYAAARHLLDGNRDNHRSATFDIAISGFTLYFGFLFLWSLCVGHMSQLLGTTSLLVFLGAALTLLALWAWWRCNTFMHYLAILSPRIRSET